VTLLLISHFTVGELIPFFKSEQRITDNVTFYDFENSEIFEALFVIVFAIFRPMYVHDVPDVTHNCSDDCGKNISTIKVGTVFFGCKNAALYCIIIILCCEISCSFNP
jgi:hypothetical protein